MKKLTSGLHWEQIALTGPLALLVCYLIVAHQHGNSSTPVHARPAPVAGTGLSAETGRASYYGFKYQGRPTASGEIFDMNRLTAAHPTLPFGTKVRVTNLENQRSVFVRINDRGPFVQGRVIDVSQAAAEELGMLHSGVVEVRVEVVPEPETPLKRAGTDARKL